MTQPQTSSIFVFMKQLLRTFTDLELADNLCNISNKHHQERAAAEVAYKV